MEHHRHCNDPLLDPDYKIHAKDGWAFLAQHIRNLQPGSEEGAAYDAVLLDAPCTATGTLRRHPDLLRHRSAAAMAKLMELQAALLARAADWVKPGGVLAYGVCSLQPQEGEAQIAQFLEARHDFALDETTPPRRFTPDDNMDGFYLALMRKGGDG